MLRGLEIGPRQADRPVGLGRLGRPDLLTVSRQPPSALAALVDSDARSESGSWLGEELAPAQLAPQGRSDEGLALLVGAVGEDGRHRPLPDHHRRLVQAGPFEFLGNDDLRDRARLDPVRARVVGRREPALDQERTPLPRVQGRSLSQRLGRPGPKAGWLVFQPQVVAALGGQGQLGQVGAATLRAARAARSG